MNKQFGYGCEFCSGTVKSKRVDREAYKHKTGFVIMAIGTLSAQRTSKNRAELE